MGKIWLGCSGWDYRDWADVFYKSTDKSRLSAYSLVFNTAEINSTFYSYPDPGMVFGWAKFTPPDFKFTVKLNRLITHEKRLDISKGVGMKFGKDRIEEFIRILPANLHFALEYRNETWLTDEAHNLLSDYDVATVIVDGQISG